MNQKITFLLGSGISIPAKIPGVAEITEAVFSDGWYRHTSAKYVTNITSPEDDIQSVQLLQEYLGILMMELELYYAKFPNRMVNYEDLSQLSEQIGECENNRNPSVKPLIDKHESDFSLTLKRATNNDNYCRRNLSSLADEACSFIHDVVLEKISSSSIRKEPLTYLQPFRDACQEFKTDFVDLFTLNHDTLLEEYFTSQQQSFCDGFGQKVNGIRYWQENSLGFTASKIRIFKLHGSINWYRFRSLSNGTKDIIGCCINGMSDLPMDENNEPMWFDRNELFLSGTTNKLNSYTRGIFIELFWMFHQVLKKTDQLVICGYGFPDVGINTQIAEWLSENEDHKILIIHPKPDELEKTPNGVIEQYQKQIAFLERKIEETNWDEIKSKLKALSTQSNP